MAHDHHHHHGHGHGHAHSHGHDHGPVDTGDWRYLVGLILNLGFVIAEFGAGIISGSTALMADAGHNLSDVLGLALAGGAAWLARRAASGPRTYGYRKGTVLAALGNAILLLVACGWIGWEAVERLINPQPVASGWIIAVAGILILFTGVSLIDPLISLVIVVVILWSTWGLLKDSLNLALDAAPAGIEVEAVRRALLDLPGVAAVHDLHVWGLSTTDAALTAHLVRSEAAPADLLTRAQKAAAGFGVSHTTFQIEDAAQADCPDC